jgi:hypothetical protein
MSSTTAIETGAGWEWGASICLDSFIFLMLFALRAAVYRIVLPASVKSAARIPNGHAGTARVISKPVDQFAGVCRRQDRE